jgi:inorganic pyrophosphatase/exopolyphosphatase
MSLWAPFEFTGVSLRVAKGGASTVLRSLATWAAGSRATLLDHNALAPKLAADAVGPDFATSRVHGIVDHHTDQGLYLDAVGAAGFFLLFGWEILKQVKKLF